MAVTSEELARFTQFATDRVNNGGVESLEECLLLWREHAEVNEAIRRGLAEADAGLGRPAREFMEEFLQRNGQAADS